MSSIDLRHDHSLTPAQARAAIDEAARKLTDRYGVASHWEGDTLRISRSGVEGAIALLPQQVHVTAEPRLPAVGDAADGGIGNPSAIVGKAGLSTSSLPLLQRQVTRPSPDGRMLG